MAVTYKKSLKTVVFTLHDGSTVTAADTAESALGSEALGMYHAGKLIVVPGESTTEFYADQVVKAVITVAQSEDLTRDAYGCDEK